MLIFLVKLSFNSLYKFLPIFLLGIGPNFKFSPIFLSEFGLNFLYEFLLILVIFKKLSLIFLFIFKYYFLLAKSLLLFDLLSFLGLFLDQDLPIAGFSTFINKDYIRNLISSLALSSFSYIIDLLIIINCFI